MHHIPVSPFTLNATFGSQGNPAVPEQCITSRGQFPADQSNAPYPGLRPYTLDAISGSQGQSPAGQSDAPYPGKPVHF